MIDQPQALGIGPRPHPSLRDFVDLVTGLLAPIGYPRQELLVAARDAGLQQRARRIPQRAVDAQRLGLVDHLGSFEDAVKAAAQRAKLTSYATQMLEPELTWAEQLALQLKSRAAVAMLHLSSGDRSLAQVAEIAQRFDPLTREVARLSRFSVQNRLYAYCFCEVR